jgi:hypothetical protein
MRTFMDWLVVEYGTVAQQLKNNPDPKIPQIKESVRKELQKFEPFKNLKTDGEILVNFLTKNALEELSNTTAFASVVNLQQAVSHVIGHYMREFGDFMFATWQHTKSKLNSPNYTKQQIKLDSDKWHEDIAAKKATMPSEEYEVFIDLKGPWQGWKWVLLGRGYCPEEAKAMGHCGNSGAREGDDILSLRDPEGKAHLTFIVNDGILGEMKGRANGKPSKRYHPAIIELLKHPEIKSVRGGGYAPERNFSLKDLSEQERKQLETAKPDIGSPIMYMLKSGKKEELAAELGVEPEEISLEGNEVVLATFNELDELEEIVSGPAFSWWFGDDRDRNDGGGWDTSWRDIEDYVDEELEDLMIKVAKNEEDEAEDAGEAFDNNDTVRSLISSAFHDAYQAGAEQDAWKRFKNLMNDPEEEYGFWVDMEKYPYRLMISLEGLNRMGRLNDQEYYSLKDMIKRNQLFDFDEPYGGFSGFDEEYFLQNAKESLQTEIK